MAKHSRLKFSVFPSLAASALSWVLTPESAEAHVKWFCAFDVAGQPRGLENVLCPDFELLAGVSVLVLGAACLVEGTVLGGALIRSLDRVTGIIQDNTELMFRAVCGFFFVCLWSMGGILLTPELRTTSDAVPWIQLAMAASMLSRRTMPLGAIGIAWLFSKALLQYGSFHLMDYPIFLGVALYLALTPLNRTFFGMRPIDVVRWASAITLMWASIEKWAYPEWTFPLFVTHAKMAMGFDREFFMRAAGTVEFTLAFCLIWTPLVRRGAAIVLAAMFVTAVTEFGKIDAVGHSPIVIAMLAIAADSGVPATKVVEVKSWVRRFVPALTVPFGFAAALALFLSVYYGLHAVMFGTTIL